MPHRQDGNATWKKVGTLIVHRPDGHVMQQPVMRNEFGNERVGTKFGGTSLVSFCRAYIESGCRLSWQDAVEVESPSYWCSCGRVRYFKSPEGHWVATRIFAGNEWKKFSYALFRWHENLHRRLDEGGTLEVR